MLVDTGNFFMGRGAAITLHYTGAGPSQGSSLARLGRRALHNIAFPDALKAASRPARRVAALMLLAGFAAVAHGQSLDVLHWWTSAGERRAVDELVQQLDRRGIT